MKVNANFDNLVPNYLFADVARKTNEYIAANPDKPVIRMGIGDVTLPLCKAAVDALKKGAEDLAHKESFKGYPITLVAAGLLALAFMGFSGLKIF